MATGVPFLLAISKAGADPGSASMAMADDLAGLRRLVLGMVVMVDGSPCDVNVQDGDHDHGVSEARGRDRGRRRAAGRARLRRGGVILVLLLARVARPDSAVGVQLEVHLSRTVFTCARLRNLLKHVWVGAGASSMPQQRNSIEMSAPCEWNP